MVLKTSFETEHTLFDCILLADYIAPFFVKESFKSLLLSMLSLYDSSKSNNPSDLLCSLSPDPIPLLLMLEFPLFY